MRIAARCRPVNAIQEEQRDFVAAVRTGKAPRVDGAAGRDAVAVAEMILERIDEHAWDGTAAGRHGPFAMPALPIIAGTTSLPPIATNAAARVNEFRARSKPLKRCQPPALPGVSAILGANKCYCANSQSPPCSCSRLKKRLLRSVRNAPDPASISQLNQLWRCRSTLSHRIRQRFTMMVRCCWRRPSMRGHSRLLPCRALFVTTMSVSRARSKNARPAPKECRARGKASRTEGTATASRRSPPRSARHSRSW